MGDEIHSLHSAHSRLQRELILSSGRKTNQVRSVCVTIQLTLPQLELSTETRKHSDDTQRIVWINDKRSAVGRDRRNDHSEDAYTDTGLLFKDRLGKKNLNLSFKCLMLVNQLLSVHH